MHFTLDFEGNSDIGAYVRLTNKYIIVGRSQSRNVLNFFKEHFECPIVETTINTIRTVGSLCVGNSRALILPDTCTDQEMMHIRNSLPQEIKVVRMTERNNCLGNIIICNDHVCLVNGDLEDENIRVLENALEVPVYRNTIGSESLVGTYAVMNNQGMLTGPNITEEELRELGELLRVRVIAGTVNSGHSTVGSGIVVNDWVQISGRRCTNVEVKVAESVFAFSDNRISENIVADEIVQ
ncbi:translation initiation factor 6 [Enteropsectra breve]|nr:translation initiation factor 6 [Enteropsectra breve]KAI5151883.1 translation initiation factor 6 [Enteropsectra breve]